MVLQDILEALASSELVNLSCVSNGEVTENKIPQVVNAINLGLIKLYTRFFLNKQQILLTTIEQENTYEIPDCIEILEVINPKGIPVRFDDPNGISLSKPNILFFHDSVLRGDYTIGFNALPERVDYVNDTGISIDLPLVYLNALLCFIASRFYSPVGVAMDSNRNGMDMNYLQRYEQECQLLEAKGFDVDMNQDSDVFSQRGFI